MIDNWISDFEAANRNALSAEWFVSPLEYFWTDGKTLLDKLFPGSSSPNSTFDELASPEIFKNSMQIDFRAKMMVFAFMRQDISKSYGFEIENGLLHLYRLDFISCLSQWVYVIEGYSRKLFSVASLQNVKTNSWQIPTSDAALDRLINSLSASLAHYLDGVMFSVKDMESKAITSLTSEGHVVEECDDQAEAGLMKPNLVRALIQRGALR